MQQFLLPCIRFTHESSLENSCLITNTSLLNPGFGLGLKHWTESQGQGGMGVGVRSRQRMLYSGHASCCCKPGLRGHHCSSYSSPCVSTPSYKATIVPPPTVPQVSCFHRPVNNTQRLLARSPCSSSPPSCSPLPH